MNLDREFIIADIPKTNGWGELAIFIHRWNFSQRCCRLGYPRKSNNDRLVEMDVNLRERLTTDQSVLLVKPLSQPCQSQPFWKFGADRCSGACQYFEDRFCCRGIFYVATKVEELIAVADWPQSFI